MSHGGGDEVVAEADGCAGGDEFVRVAPLIGCAEGAGDGFEAVGEDVGDGAEEVAQKATDAVTVSIQVGGSGEDLAGDEQPVTGSGLVAEIAKSGELPGDGGGRGEVAGLRPAGGRRWRRTRTVWAG